MKISETNFRDVYRRLVFIGGSAIRDKVKIGDVFDYPPEEALDGYVAYACVNDDGQFMFHIIAGAQIEGERIKITPGSYKRSVALWRAEIQNAKIRVLAENFAKAFSDRLQVLNDAYSFDKRRELTRCLMTIDTLRHPDFPDDAKVYFHGEGLRPELAWVRCKDIRGNLIEAELLQELQQDFGYKKGDAVQFVTADFNGETIGAVISFENDSSNHGVDGLGRTAGA